MSKRHSFTLIYSLLLCDPSLGVFAYVTRCYIIIKIYWRRCLRGLGTTYLRPEIDLKYKIPARSYHFVLIELSVSRHSSAVWECVMKNKYQGSVCYYRRNGCLLLIRLLFSKYWRNFLFGHYTSLNALCVVNARWRCSSAIIGFILFFWVLTIVMWSSFLHCYRRWNNSLIITDEIPILLILVDYPIVITGGITLVITGCITFKLLLLVALLSSYNWWHYS